MSSGRPTSTVTELGYDVQVSWGTVANDPAAYYDLNQLPEGLTLGDPDPWRLRKKDANLIIAHFIDRQKKINSGELQGPVFRFHHFRASGESEPVSVKQKAKAAVNGEAGERKERAKKKRKKAVAQMLGGAVAAVALKDSKFNKRGEIGSLHSARRLARDLFENLRNVDPERSELTVEGTLGFVFIWV